MSKYISVVVPVYRCDECLKKLCDRLAATLTTITDAYEIILVDDRSPDASWEIIKQLRTDNKSIKALRLSRNFGQHLAITAGLEMSKGDYVVVLDCDLQDPPELISELYNKLSEGCDYVLARRIERNHSLFRLFSANLYFRLISRLTNENVDGSYGNLSILSRKVVNAFLRFGESERHYLFIVRWLGFKRGVIEYGHQEREIGESAYSLKMLISHAVNGLFFQATTFLTWIITVGLGFALLGMLLAAFYVYKYFTHGSVEGWTTVVVLILICTGFIVTSLGVIGVYIGKIFTQSKGRPIYLVDEVLDD